MSLPRAPGHAAQIARLEVMPMSPPCAQGAAAGHGAEGVSPGKSPARTQKIDVRHERMERRRPWCRQT
jgi:hypothetical protein